ncbi:MAG: hypothetical protein OWT28_05090, partial [Firmicutes bacterium]|nr:hypothetical protein [Bacillota bacterium]
MEHKMILRPQSHDTEAAQPQRRKSVMPSGMGKPQIVPVVGTEPSIPETRRMPAQPRAESRKKRPKFEERFDRVTTYIRKDLHEEIRRRYDNLEI